MYRFFPVLANKVVIPMDIVIPPSGAKDLRPKAYAYALPNSVKRSLPTQVPYGGEMACAGDDDGLMPERSVEARVVPFRLAAAL